MENRKLVEKLVDDLQGDYVTLEIFLDETIKSVKKSYMKFMVSASVFLNHPEDVSFSSYQHVSDKRDYFMDSWINLTILGKDLPFFSEEKAEADKIFKKVQNLFDDYNSRPII